MDPSGMSNNPRGHLPWGGRFDRLFVRLALLFGVLLAPFKFVRLPAMKRADEGIDVFLLH